MLGRKISAAYFTTWTIVIGFTFPFLTMGGTWQATGNFLSLAYVVAIYAVPSIFLYGIFISSLLEITARKLSVTGPVEWVISADYSIGTR